MNILGEITYTTKKRSAEYALLRSTQVILKRMEAMLLRLEFSDAAMRSDLERVITSGGKRLRPILAYVCYRMGQKTISPILPLMCMLELMHTTSLIHDDVVDNATVRRGKATINASSGVTKAVQSGDYLLAEAMGYLKHYEGTGINEILIQASAEMCLGELCQLKIRNTPERLTHEIYFSQIKRKTASLLAASCMTGGLAGGMYQSEVEALRTYGEKLGVAFQLSDDLLDFSEALESGKEPGQDLQNNIFTLPVLELLKGEMPILVRDLLFKENKDRKDVAFLVEYIRDTRVLDTMKKMIRATTEEAIESLHGLRQSTEKAALTKLAVSLSERRT